MGADSNREAGLGAKCTSEEECGLKGVWGVGNDQLPPERTAEKRALRAKSLYCTSRTSLFCETKDIGELIYMGRKAAMAGGGRARAAVRAVGAKGSPGQSGIVW